MKLFPPPKRIITKPGQLDLRATLPIIVKRTFSDRFRQSCQRFAMVHENFKITARDDLSPALRVHLSGGTQSIDAYTISIHSKGIDIRAGQETGAFRGLTTLSQMLRQSRGKLTYCQITDEPDFAHRGVMLDISRCKVPTLATFKQLIDQFADLKYNQLQLYTEHTFAFIAHESVWRDASPLTADDLLEIQRYCTNRYIELVPNFNSFGHFERWLRHEPYKGLAECPNGFVHPISGQRLPFGSTLKPTKKSLDFIAALYREYLPLFDSHLVNIGGDEPWELGLGFSRRRCEREGKTAVYLDFLGKLQALVTGEGRKPLFWGDIVLEDPACLPQLSNAATALIWGYEANHPFSHQCQQMKASGIPFYVCPGTSSWNSLTGRLTNAAGNLALAGQAGKRHGAEGYLVTDWGDHGHHQTLPISYPGFVLGASASWHTKANIEKDLASAINLVFFKLGSLALAKRLLALGKTPDGLAAQPPNATLFNRLLFWPMRDEPRLTERVTNRALDRSLNELSTIEKETLPNLTSELSLVQSELSLGAAMARQGLEHLTLFRRQQDGSKGLTRERQRLGRQLKSIREQHRACWLARNRPGGLEESLTHLAQGDRY
ncbi:MAG: beta-N-acetylhexosaminidase [Pseudomonadales bacterium]